MAVLAYAFNLLSGNLTVFLLSLSVLFLAVVIFRQPRRRLPVGPKGWPLVGYLKGIGPHVYLHYSELAKQFKSDLVSFNIGPQVFVILNTYDAIKQAFLKQGDVFSGRTHTMYKDFMAKGNGIITAEGKEWKIQRKFTLVTLRGFGMGRLGMEERILTEIQYFIENVKHHNGVAFDIRNLLSASVSNVISIVCFGERFEYDDDEFIDLLRRLDENFKYGGALNPVNILRFLRHLPGDRWHFHLIIENLRRILSFVGRAVEEHKKTFQEGNPRDYIDIYLEEMKLQDELPTSRQEPQYNEMQLRQNIVDLFVAGSETTNTTLRWAILYMMLYPQTQAKVQRELDQVVGRDRLPRTEDRPKLHYTESVLLEIHRHCTMGPLGVAHTATEDANLLGYDLPKGTLLVSNIWEVHHDEKLWEKPIEFVPGRFLDGDGHFQTNDYVIPFSIGRRMCLGEALAKMELFLYFTSILQSFTLKLPDNSAPPDMKGTFGITRAPCRFEVEAVERD